MYAMQQEGFRTLPGHGRGYTKREASPRDWQSPCRLPRSDTIRRAARVKLESQESHNRSRPRPSFGARRHDPRTVLCCARHRGFSIERLARAILCWCSHLAHGHTVRLVWASWQVRFHSQSRLVLPVPPCCNRLIPSECWNSILHYHTGYPLIPRFAKCSVL